MAAIEARILANQQNPQHSAGSKTLEGKEQSRANSSKPGVTGTGTVLPQREAVEVERRVVAFHAELQPSGEVGIALVRRAATLSVRMERCVEFENTTLTDRVRRAEAEFVPPEGVDATEAAKLRVEAGKLAMFDASREATLARRYEAAAERGFFRALKELRQLEKDAKAAKDELADDLTDEMLGSFSELKKLDEEFGALYPDEAPLAARTRFSTPRAPEPAATRGPVDVPITIGRRR